MLVLTRRIGEEIVIAGNIRVMVVRVRGRTVQLGVTAPLSVPVVRQELVARCAEGGGATTVRGNAGGPEGVCASARPAT
jgi:carbon storage regulator